MIKIHKINKDDLSVERSTLDIEITGMSKTRGMTVSHYASSTKASEVTIPFSIEGVDTHVPHIEEIEFSTVVRKKIDLTAVGVNEGKIKEVGEDIGKYKYTDAVPKSPSDLPPGFQELYR